MENPSESTVRDTLTKISIQLVQEFSHQGVEVTSPIVAKLAWALLGSEVEYDARAIMAAVIGFTVGKEVRR